jgi:hypothetical protein
MICKKRKFDKKTAKSILNRNAKGCGSWRREVRYYECPICKSWHLTSLQEYEEPVKLGLEELSYKEHWKLLLV